MDDEDKITFLTALRAQATAIAALAAENDQVNVHPVEKMMQSHIEWIDEQLAKFGGRSDADQT